MSGAFASGLSAQLSTLQVLSSILSLNGELTLSQETSAALPGLTNLAATSTPPSPNPNSLPTELVFTVLLLLLSESGHHTQPTPSDDSSLRLTVALPLPSDPTTSAPAPLLTLHHPPWLSRTSHAALSASLLSFLSSTAVDDDPDSPSYILDALEWLRDQQRELWASHQLEEEEERERAKADPVGNGATGGKLVRVWFWLPSLSTREKRDDIVKWAPEYGLTGFVLAGKPALLCVEGNEGPIDSYMNDIKSVSWADIPSFQKKISERHRTPLDSPSDRAFTKMEEITGLVDKGGARGNRGEMGQVRDWLIAKNLGDAFGLVIGGGSF